VLRFDYVARGQEDAGWQPPRRAEPHHLVIWGGRWYLVGWDLDRKDWRTYRVDRMQTKTGTGPKFPPRALPAEDLSSWIAERFNRWPDPCRGTVVLRMPAATVATWAGSGPLIEAIDETSCRVTAGSWSWGGLAAWFGIFDVDLEIEGPDELREAARQLAVRYGTAAGTAQPR
jgi:predicted DNA-binding transcriptional regulator YafY